MSLIAVALIFGVAIIAAWSILWRHAELEEKAEADREACVRRNQDMDEIRDARAADLQLAIKKLELESAERIHAATVQKEAEAKLRTLTEEIDRRIGKIESEVSKANLHAGLRGR